MKQVVPARRLFSRRRTRSDSELNSPEVRTDQKSPGASFDVQTPDATVRLRASTGLFTQTVERDTAELDDATERISTQLYMQAIEQDVAGPNDATERVSPELYAQALRRGAAEYNDVTERVSTQLYMQALEEGVAAAAESDATERVSTRLSQKYIEQAQREEASALSRPERSRRTSKGLSSTPKPKQEHAPRRKRSFWNVRSILHLLADILLLGLILFVSISAYEINMRTSQEQKAWQVQQQVALAQARQVQQAQQAAQLAAQQRIQQIETQARTDVHQFDQAAASWGKAHLYKDSFDGHSYLLDSGYTGAGIGAYIDSDLAAAQTPADYESVTTEAVNALFNLRMLEADYHDHTPYNKVHASDTQVLTHYSLEKKQVLLVSTTEQVMRVYQQGKLVRAFYITAGRSERPSLPGVWTSLARQSPTIFSAADPPGSPYWFPDTPINYAILYHYGGFFVHDAPWRGTFGPGTQFPHLDADGNTPYNFDGSHGCINLSEDDAAWVYHHTDWNTVVVIY